jgi:hypothetical protein
MGLSLLIGGTFGASIEAGAMTSSRDLGPSVVGTPLLTGKLMGVVALLFNACSCARYSGRMRSGPSR